MGERVTISYRGATYELGRGKRCYGIWAAGAPGQEPVQRWPETPEGWVAAWTRFTEMEKPETIAPVGQHQVPGQASPDPFVSASGGAFSAAGSFPAQSDTLAFGRPAETSWTGGTAGTRLRPAANSVFAAALLGIGVICGLVGLFPHYQVGQSLASEPASLIPHVAYLAVWTLAALLIALRVGPVARAGALLAAGTSVVTFGLFGADLGLGLSVADVGLWISLVGWLACTAGAVLAVLATSRGAIGKNTLGVHGIRGAVRVGLLTVAAIGASLTFFPNWDSYLLHASTSGQSQEQALGYAFNNPGWVQAFDVAIMLLFVLVVIVAALWRPIVGGAMLLAGAVIPMAAQAVSGIVQATEPTSPTIFGISDSQAQQIGLSITNGLTPAFWAFCLFVVVLLVSCAWMLISPPEQPVAAVASAPVLGPPRDTVTEPVPGLVSEPTTEPAPELATHPVPAPVTEPVPAAQPLSQPATQPVPGSASDTWTERELAADNWDDNA
jgi:hypothetical protein